MKRYNLVISTANGVTERATSVKELKEIGFEGIIVNGKRHYFGQLTKGCKLYIVKRCNVKFGHRV